MAAKNSTTTRVNFTAARVRDFTCPPDKGEVTLWDSAAPGLGLRARSGGAKSYLFQYRIHGKAARVTIGSPDAWTLDQARAEARRLKVLVDQGIDPREEREAKAREHEAKQLAKEEKAREEARQALTLGDVWPHYIEARKDHWGKHSLADHHKAMQAPGLPRKRSKLPTAAGPLYALRDVRLVDLTPERLQAWLQTETRTRPTVASRAYRLLRACLNWASEEPQYAGLIQTKAVTAKKVKQLIPRAEAKDDSLQQEQLAAWFAEVRKIQNQTVSVYLQALLLTGARPESLRALRWEDVDLKWHRLTLRDKVASWGGLNRTRTIPLTPYVASLLLDLKRRAASVRPLRDGQVPEPSPWVFASSTSASGYICEPARLNARVCELAGILHVSPHGLRRSFGTLSEWVECPDGIVKQIQGHVPGDVANKHYRVRPLDLLRLWHTKIEAWILEQAGIEQPAVERTLTGLRVVKAGERS